MFHLESLHKAVSELNPYAENFKEKADKVSDDIRKLEKYLSEKFLGIEIGINVEDHHIDEEHMKVFDLAGMGKDLKFLLREFLIWGKDETSQKFRIMYETHSLKGDKINGYQIWPEKKPLIEYPLFDRIRMHSRLPILINHMKNLLSSVK